MITFELSKSDEKLEIHGDRDGLLQLASILRELALSDPTINEYLFDDGEMEDVARRFCEEFAAAVDSRAASRPSPTVPIWPGDE